jgi:small redox-active disulfide protein 2
MSETIPGHPADAAAVHNIQTAASALAHRLLISENLKVLLMEVIIMSLFGFGKKKEENNACCCSGSSEPEKREQKEPACACSGPVETFEAGSAEAQVKTGLTGVKVLGSGCKSCHALLVSTNEALKKMGIPFEAEYVTDMAVVASYGVMSTPALVVNEKVVSMGKVYSAAEVEKLLHKLGY